MASAIAGADSQEFISEVPSSTSAVTTDATATEPIILTQSEKAETKVLETVNTTKSKVQEYFSDIPVMVDVAKCESGFKQFNSDGSVIRGVSNSQDVCVMQINEKYHADTAIRLGYNLYTLDGNMAYARYLYQTQGTAPWKYSSHCWNKYREVAIK